MRRTEADTDRRFSGGTRLLRARVQELGNSRNDLRRRKWLLKQNAVWYTEYRPFIGGAACHVNHGKMRIDLSGGPRDFPAVEAAQQIDVGDESSVGLTTLQKRDGFLAGLDGRDLKASLRESLFDDQLDRILVFDQQNGWKFRGVHI
jgi:hypothetical protein